MMTMAMTMTTTTMMIRMYGPVVVGLRSEVEPFVFVVIGPRCLLIVGDEEIAAASLVIIGSIVQKELHHRWILVYDRHMQHILTYIDTQYTHIRTYTHIH